MNRSARIGVETAALALLVSITIGSVLMLFAGKSPGHVWWDMLANTLGDPYRSGQVLYRTTGLALTGLSVALALDAGLFNIGGEAQVTAGVLGCAQVRVTVPSGICRQESAAARPSRTRWTYCASGNNSSSRSMKLVHDRSAASAL